MYPGDIEIINSATSLTGANLSRAVAPCCTLAGAPSNVTIINKSAASLTIKVARDYVAADFEQLSGLTVPATSSLSFSTTAPFLAVLPASDPGSGEISVCR
jgi:type IV secretory pathway TrbD component